MTIIDYRCSCRLRNFVRLVPALGLSLLISACAMSSRPLRQDAAVEVSKSESAFVIIGESYDGPLQQGIFSKEVCPPLWSTWVPFGSPEALKTMNTFESGGTRCSKLHPDEPIGYNVYQLTPGLYALRSTTHMSLDGKTYSTTRFYQSPAKFNEVRTLKFRANKGEIIYLGNIAWGFYYPANIKSFSFDLAAARAALSKIYPGIKGELRPARFEPLPKASARPGMPTPPPETPDNVPVPVPIPLPPSANPKDGS